MADVTVKQLAEVVGIPVDRLISQLSEAGLPITDADQTISDKDKMELSRTCAAPMAMTRREG